MPNISVKFDAAITLRSDDGSCYLESQATNESPSARIERPGHPLLSFERCVFRLVRTESSIVDHVSRDTMVYGSTVRIVNPATMLVACVVRTETASGGKGYRVAMRPLDLAPMASSTFRVASNMRNRSGTDHVRNRDHIVLQLDNSELCIGTVEDAAATAAVGVAGDGSVEVVASMEPKTWVVTMFDEGYSAAATGFAFASRVLAIEHRYHRSFLTHGPPLRPADHRRAAARRSLWLIEENNSEGHRLDMAEIVAANNAPTSSVYFQAPSSSEGGSESGSGGGGAMVSMKLNCSCTALWIAENLDPTMGGPLRVGHYYRLRHMSSGRYLSVAETGPGRFEMVTLSESDEDMLRRSVFVLDSNAEDEQGHISSYHSFVRLQHVETGLWLSSKPHVELSVARTEVVRRPNAHDRISLRHPSDTIVSKMLLLMNYITSLREHVQTYAALHGTPLSVGRLANDADLRSLSDRTTETLQALLFFCSHQDEPHHRNGGQGRLFGGAGDAHNRGGGGDAGLGGLAAEGDGMSHDEDGLGYRQNVEDCMPNKEHQQMLLQLQMTDLVFNALIAPFSPPAASSGGGVSLRNGVLSLNDLHDRQCGHLLRVHTAGLALIQRMSKQFEAGSNAAAQYCDALIQFETAHIKSSSATLLVVLESATDLEVDKEIDIARTLVGLMRESTVKPNAATAYLACLSNLNKARDEVSRLVTEFEHEILYTMSTGFGRMLVAPPRPEGGARYILPSPAGNAELGATASTIDGGPGGSLVSRGNALGPNSSVHDVIPFEIFVSNGESEKVACFIASVELLIRIAPRERDSDAFRFVASRITREHVIHVLKLSVHASSSSSRGDSNPMHTIQALFVEAAMQLYLVPRLEDQWVPIAPVVSKEFTDAKGTAAVSPSNNSKRQAATASPPGTPVKHRSAAVSSPSVAALKPPTAGRDGAPSVGDASFIRQIKASTLDVLKANQIQVLQHKGRNQLIGKCVAVWGLILRHGLATQNEVEDVLPVLLTLMDGRSDQFSSHVSDVSWRRYEYNDNAVPVVDTKIQVCAVLSGYLNGQIQQAVRYVATSIASGERSEDIVVELDRRMQRCRQLLNFPDCCAVLLDLVRYHSDDLARVSVGLLSELCYMFESLLVRIKELIVLPTALRRPFDRVTHFVAALHAKILAGSSDVVGELDALTGTISSVAGNIASTAVYQHASSLEGRGGSFAMSLTNKKLRGHREDDIDSSGRGGPGFASATYDDDDGEEQLNNDVLSDSTAQHQSILLNIIGALNVHEILMRGVSAVWQQQKHGLQLHAVLRFLTLFAAIPTNAQLFAADWPVFFDMMLQVPDNDQQSFLRLLEKLLPHGNKVSPLTRADIRSIVRIYAREHYVEAIRVLSSMFKNSVAKPDQQRDVVALLIDSGQLGDQWWVKCQRAVLSDLIELMMLCCEGNSYVQVSLQRAFHADAVLLFFQTLHVDETALKTLLLQFLTVTHLRPADAAESAPLKEQRASTGGASLFVNQTWTVSELWWRVIRDDISMRFDELATTPRVNKGWREKPTHDGAPSLRASEAGTGNAWRRYTFECAVVLEAYFSFRFVLQQAVKVDWVVKEIRSLASSVTQLLFMLPQLQLGLAEIDSIVALGLAMVDALASFNESMVPRLRASCEEAVRHRATVASTVERERQGKRQWSNGADHRRVDDRDDGQDSTAARRGMTHTSEELEALSAVLRDVIDLRQDAAVDDKDRCVAVVAECVTPKILEDISDPMRLVIEKLLRLCGQQVLAPHANAFALRVMEQSVQQVPPEKLVDVQVVLGECGALQVTTILLDATDKAVVACALSLGIAVMTGGNTRNQNAFLRYFTSNDERFFVSAKRTLETGALEVRHFRKSLLSASCSGGTAPHLANHGRSLLEDQYAAAFPCCQPLLRFIQLLCEGHHFQLQEYCREQRDNLRSVNSVQFCVAFLSALVEGVVHPELVENVLQCLANLTEFCQGPCSGNQAMLVSSELIHIIERLLRSANIGPRIKRAATTTLIALVEGSTDAHIAETIIRQMSLDNFETLFHGSLQGADEDAVALVFDVGIFLRTIGDLLNETKHRQVFSQRIHAILASRPDMDRQTGRIQIQRNERLELVYFRVPQTCRRIRYDSKEKLLWDVDRSSQSAKYSSFHDLCEDLILELDLVASQEAHVFAITDSIPSPAVKDFVRRGMNASQRTWITSSVCLAFVGNFCLLLDWRSRLIHLPLGIAQVAVCVVALGINWNISGAVYLHKRRRKRERHASSSTSSLAIKGTMHCLSEALLWLRRSGFSAAPTTAAADEGNTTHPGGLVCRSMDDGHRHADAVAQQYETLVKCTRSSFLCGLVMLFASLAGLVCPEFFATHLFWCIALSPSLQNVIAAVTLNRRTLAVTLFLGMLFCYAFSLVGYAMFPEDFDTDDDELTRENCDSLLHCFVYIATTGLRQGGGVGDAMKTIPWGHSNFVVRRIFDFLYFTIMIVIFLNILFGIIIDTFAELRDAKHAKEQDMRMKCFVCGLGSHVFDQYGDGFANHTKHEHSMWQYLYFMQHLRLKDPNDYTGQESYVALKLAKKDFSFFPTRSLNLERRQRLVEERDSKHARGGTSVPGVPGNGVEDEEIPLQGGGRDMDLRAMAPLLHMLHNDVQLQREEMRAVAQRLSTSDRSAPHLDPLRSRRVSHLVRHATTNDRALSTESTLRNPTDIATVMPQPGGGGLGAGGIAMAPLLLTGNEFRVGENVSTQTAFSESVIGVERDLIDTRRENATLVAELKRLKAEMRAQLDEIRKLQVDHQHLSELQHALSNAKNDVKAKQRQLDANNVERDATVRQNLFLQSELDRIVLQNAKLNTAGRSLATRLRVEDSFRSGASTPTQEYGGTSQSLGGGLASNNNNSTYLHRGISTAEQLLERSRRFESLALEDTSLNYSLESPPQPYDTHARCEGEKHL